MKLQSVYTFSVSKKKDVELLMHHACPIWVNISKNNLETKHQLDTFLRIHVLPNAKRISDRLGINPPLEAIHLDYIYRACSFEGLFQDTQLLKSDKYFLQVNSRKFRTSKIIPFGSNVYFEIYNCTNRYDMEPKYSTTLIRVLVNEESYVIPGSDFK
ncbi:8958_t:CDS:2 [Diversispora eburnea]|uniref:Multiple inositol polyphosphate phosphatase 1 n=1 Tax=Diversispora eburnea TaxID=1213867 RepID=A0A9N8WEP6_9GLOM|nr:8958_t:CDS:2 [Diversispora eburnea]